MLDFHSFLPWHQNNQISLNIRLHHPMLLKYCSKNNKVKWTKLYCKIETTHFSYFYYNEKTHVIRYRLCYWYHQYLFFWQQHLYKRGSTEITSENKTFMISQAQINSKYCLSINVRLPTAECGWTDHHVIYVIFKYILIKTLFFSRLFIFITGKIKSCKLGTMFAFTAHTGYKQVKTVSCMERNLS